MAATSSVLSGLSLATGVARDAADGVPVVKQLLGVAARVVSLAQVRLRAFFDVPIDKLSVQHVDKNRTDLHALADRAKRMDAAIEAALGDREPDGHILRRLEDMNATLRAIEQLFVKHAGRGRVHRVLGYIFTVQHEIERLQGEFDDRLSELQTAANVEASLVARENSRFIGEFRNVRHCEINLLRRIGTLGQTKDGRRITYNFATCEGSNQKFIVRSVVASSRCEDTRRNIDQHERILEVLSFIQTRHPAIPYLYGRNAGPLNNRFTILCTGDLRPWRVVRYSERRSIFPNIEPTLSVLGSIAAKLADAACHLRKLGAAWKYPYGFKFESIYLDKKGNPKIGLFDDLYHASINPAHQATRLMTAMTWLLDSGTTESHVSPSGFRSTLWQMQLFGALTDAGYCTSHQQNTVRRADIFGLVPLTQESMAYLRPAKDWFAFSLSLWGSIVLRLAMGSRKWQGSMLRAIYSFLPQSGAVHIIVLCVEDDGETVHTVDTGFEIPLFAAKDIRHTLGIPVIPLMDEKPVPLQLVRTARLGETSVECTGWRSDAPGLDKSLPW